MNELDKYGKEFLKGSNAKKLEQLVNTPEGKKLAEIVDAKTVEDAAKRGDMAELKKILNQVLSTDEGKKLAADVANALGKK